MKPTLHGAGYCIVRRVPAKYQEVSDKGRVRISLDTKDIKIANQRMNAAWENQISMWEAKLSGGGHVDQLRYDAARERSRSIGVPFFSAQAVSEMDLEEIIARVKLALIDAPVRDPVLIDAALGAAAAPRFRVSEILELFWDVTKDRDIGRSQLQVKKSRAPRMKAHANFINLKGDPYLNDVTRDDLLDFRDWWIRKVREESLTPNSANKDLTYLTGTWREVNRAKRFNLQLPIEDLSIEDNGGAKRPPFSVDWIKNKLLAPGALDGLDLQARCILIGMINTGYRTSEGASLTEKYIHLDCDMPYIEIAPDGRKLKNRNSERKIPLVGCSLEAFRACPGGFPKYRDNTKISDIVNKFLTDNGLRETARHTMYSLRHSFEDRLLENDVDERVRSDLMGHSIQRQRYGDGGGDVVRYRAIQKIAI